MSIIVFILIVVLCFVVLGFVLRMLKGVARVMFSGVVLLLLVIGAVWLAMDANDLGRHFYQDEKLFLLYIDGQVSGAFVLGPSDIPKPIGDLSEIRSAYPDLSKIQGEYYKVLVLNWSVVQGDIDILNFKASSDEIKSALVSENPRQLFIEKTSKALGGGMIADLTAQVLAIYPSNDFFSSTMFSILAAKPLSNPDLVFAGIKQGTVQVYPETAVFKILKILPSDLAKVLVPVKNSQ